MVSQSLGDGRHPFPVKSLQLLIRRCGTAYEYPLLPIPQLNRRVLRLALPLELTHMRFVSHQVASK
jgi:hypothetical protein